MGFFNCLDRSIAFLLFFSFPKVGIELLTGDVSERWLDRCLIIKLI